jgi:predicted CoA-substrate-specific enzyme activase
MAWYLGIDIGSAFSKGVILGDSEISAFAIIRSGSNYQVTAKAILKELFAKVSLGENDITKYVATGIGAGNVPLTQVRVSDPICTARGIKEILPLARTIIEVGGQSTRVMRIDTKGLMINFTNSEKCASGSGRFVEVITKVLRIDLEDFGPLSVKSGNPINFSTECAVFGESEAITRVAEGASKEDIVAGVNKSLAVKISSLIKKIKMEEPCAICGGGALNIGLIKAIEKDLNISLLVPEHPQIVAALGAAITARMLSSGSINPTGPGSLGHKLDATLTGKQTGASLK